MYNDHKPIMWRWLQLDGIRRDILTYGGRPMITWRKEKVGSIIKLLEAHENIPWPSMIKRWTENIMQMVENWMESESINQKKKTDKKNCKLVIKYINIGRDATMSHNSLMDTMLHYRHAWSSSFTFVSFKLRSTLGLKSVLISTIPFLTFFIKLWKVTFVILNGTCCLKETIQLRVGKNSYFADVNHFKWRQLYIL